MRIHPSFWVLPFALGATLYGAHDAYARDCAAPSDCPRGYTCTGTAVSDDGGSTSTCQASACKTDSDCGAGFRCYIDAYTECVGGTCGLASICQPQYDVPCETDGDCGPGFTCSGSVGIDDCGANQDAGFPYGTSMMVPCEDVPTLPFLPPPDSGGFDVPPICQPGSTCTSNTYKTCQSHAPGSCNVDSDCPSMWTCGCESGGFVGGGELPAPPGTAAADASCAKACLEPNADLGIFGSEAGGSFGPASTADGVDAGTAGNSGDAAANAESAAPHTSDSQGGCALSGGNGGSGGAGWLWAPIGGLFVVFRRRSHRSHTPSRALVRP